MSSKKSPATTIIGGIVLLALIVWVPFFYTAFGVDRSYQTIEVKVLSIDKNILRGEMIGQFLGSASGSIANDIIIVGGQIRIGNTLFLEDLQFTHSELAYYKDTNIITMQSILTLPKAGHSNLRLSLNRREIKKIELTPDLAREIYKQFRNKSKTNSKEFIPYTEGEQILLLVSAAIMALLYIVYLAIKDEKKTKEMTLLTIMETD